MRISDNNQPSGNKPTEAVETVYIGLGGNVGDVEASMLKALDLLSANPAISLEAKSSLYKTPPWGDENQDWFLNACASLRTNLTPHDLLSVIKDIEKELKRKKTRHWGPRTIDLDILLFGERILSSEKLQIPHPRMAQRGFVLLPLGEIAPGIAINGETIEALLEQLDTSDIKRIKLPNEW